MKDVLKKPKPIGLDIFPPVSNLGDLFDDLYSAVSRREGDFARVAWRVPKPGVVHILVVERGALPKGTAGQLIAEALDLSNTLPTKRLVMEEIINQPTIDAYAAGSAPESTVLGRTALSALNQMELSQSSCSWDVGPYALRMVVDVEESACGGTPGKGSTGRPQI